MIHYGPHNVNREMEMDYGTASTGAGSTLTVETLLDAMKSLPRPKGYGLLKGSNLVGGKAYKLENTLNIGEHKYMLVVPEHCLPTVVSSLRALPSNDFQGAYRFDIY